MSDSMRDRFLQWLIPVTRAYIRYGPFPRLKRRMWERWIDPHLAYQPHPFVARTAFGPRVTGNTQEILQQYLYYFGVWEPDISYWIERRLRPGDTFIDVGANIGYYSLLASKAVGRTGRVVAIEASPMIYRSLIANVETNRILNVRAVNVAASDVPGTARVYPGPMDHTGMTVTLDELGSETDIEVRAAPLSEILTREESDTARLVKIDVEGAEWAVAQGMAPMLDDGRQDLEIVLEVHAGGLNVIGRSPEEVFQPFFERGFNLYSIENDYSAISYLTDHRNPKASRMRHPVRQEMSVVLSRRDAEEL